jgi:hypothetical protein
MRTFLTVTLCLFAWPLLAQDKFDSEIQQEKAAKKKAADEAKEATPPIAATPLIPGTPAIPGPNLLDRWREEQKEEERKSERRFNIAVLIVTMVLAADACAGILIGVWLLAYANRSPSPAPLITCPDCGGSVSRRAERCPHCGFPVRLAPEIQAVILRQFAIIVGTYCVFVSPVTFAVNAGLEYLDFREANMALKGEEATREWLEKNKINVTTIGPEEQKKRDERFADEVQLPFYPLLLSFFGTILLCWGGVGLLRITSLETQARKSVATKLNWGFILCLIAGLATFARIEYVAIKYQGAFSLLPGKVSFLLRPLSPAGSPSVFIAVYPLFKLGEWGLVLCSAVGFWKNKRRLLGGWPVVAPPKNQAP